MGEIAEAMLEGELCETCGVYMGDGVGYPRQCSSCKRESKPKKYKNKNQSYGNNRDNKNSRRDK